MDWKFWKKKKTEYNPQGRIGYYRKSNYPWYYAVIMEETGQIHDRSKIKIIDFKVDLDSPKSIKESKKHFGFYDGCYVKTDHVNWETADQQYRRVRYISEEHYNVDEMVEEDLEMEVRRGHYVNEMHTNRRRLTPHSFLNVEEDRPICGRCHNSPCECPDVEVEGPGQDPIII